MNIIDFWKAVLDQNEPELRRYFHSDAQINWHCTNERFTLDEYMVANCQYPGDWDGAVERVEELGDLTVTVTLVYPRDQSCSFHVTSFIRLKDDKIMTLDEYWADDGAPPKWRKGIGSLIKCTGHPGTVKEKSCGAVVYKRTKGGYLFLLERMKQGHLSLPKGHVEEGETEAETALREIREETNLEVLLDTRFRHVVSYSPRNGRIKDVVFFVAEAKTDRNMTPQTREVRRLFWKRFPEAKKLLTFSSDQQILEAAYRYLMEKK